MEKYKNLNQKEINQAFISACSNGDLEMVMNLLTSPGIKEHVDIHAVNDWGFRLACKNGHLDIVQYLLASPELKNNANIHASNDYGFRVACSNGHLEIVKFLIFDMNIEKTKRISDFLEDEKYGEISRWFNIRDLNGKIDKELLPSRNNKRKKI